MEETGGQLPAVATEEHIAHPHLLESILKLGQSSIEPSEDQQPFLCQVLVKNMKDFWK